MLLACAPQRLIDSRTGHAIKECELWLPVEIEEFPGSVDILNHGRYLLRPRSQQGIFGSNMNWTGGRLHRHSKSTSDQRNKSQRQYFARARFQTLRKSGTTSPLHFSFYHTGQQGSPRDVSNHTGVLVDLLDNSQSVECQNQQKRHFETQPPQR